MIKGQATLLLLCLAVFIEAQDPIWELPRCRLCNRATSFEKCDNYIVCAKGQACYVDELITDSDSVVYNAGCRDIAVCLANNKRRRGDLVACSKCCTGEDYCNEHMCGLKKESNLTLCNSCDGRDGRPQPQQYPEDCSFLRACDPTEVCFSSTYIKDATSLRHYTTCKSTKICTQLTDFMLETYRQSGINVIGRRNTKTICAVCCGEEECNRYACETIKKRIRYLDAQGHFNHTTLKEIPKTSGRK